ncbi:MAG: DUF2059 domain-containing protein [bacterium]|nr:DUF2059 domain-containing protein [bacterium]
MKKRYIYLTLVILSVMFAGSVRADEESKHKLTEELLSVMRVEDVVNEVFEQVKLIQLSQIKSLVSSEKGSAGGQVLEEKIIALIRKEFNWELVKNDYLAIYEGAFTEEEIQGLLVFHKSPLGQKLLNKNPEIISKSMGIGQKRMISIMPEVQRITKEWIAEQKNIEREKQKKEEPVK